MEYPNPKLVNAAENQNNNQHNPFYMHPGENPAVVLVTPVLSGSESFHSWMGSMKMALSFKNKFGFVDGSIPCPVPADKNFDLWNQCNDLVSSWLAYPVAPEIAENILWFNTIYEAWTDLTGSFGSSGDLYRLSDILEEIQAIKQGSTSVMSILMSLEVLVASTVVSLMIKSIIMGWKSRCHVVFPMF